MRIILSILFALFTLSANAMNNHFEIRTNPTGPDTVWYTDHDGIDHNTGFRSEARAVQYIVDQGHIDVGDTFQTTNSGGTLTYVYISTWGTGYEDQAKYGVIQTPEPDSDTTSVDENNGTRTRKIERTYHINGSPSHEDNDKDIIDVDEANSSSTSVNDVEDGVADVTTTFTYDDGTEETVNTSANVVETEVTPTTKEDTFEVTYTLDNGLTANDTAIITSTETVNTEGEVKTIHTLDNGLFVEESETVVKIITEKPISDQPEIPAYLKKHETKGDKVVDFITDTYKDFNSISDIKDFISKHGNVYIQLPEINLGNGSSLTIQYKNERGQEYQGILWKKSF